jgi:two-component system CheB/CheR fusion protein
MDKDLAINSWTAGAAKIFGYETEEVIGNPCEIIFTEEDRKNGITKMKIETALKVGRVADNRWHVHKDGNRFWAFGVIFPLTGKDGQLMGFIKILRDLTERKESENSIVKYIKELEELNTHKETILALLSHDLRSPLSGIIQLAELLKENFKTMEEQELQKMLDLLYDLTIDELKMFDSLVKWASIKYASEAYSPSPVELSSHVAKAFDTLKLLAVSNNIHLNNEIQENVTVFADEKMLHSIFQNLVSNAIKYSFNGGEIIVSATKHENMILVRVKDFGIGMSKEMLEKLFTPHVTALLKVAEEQGNGAGIGLLLVKGFVEKNGGEICFDSVEGEGSSFYFTLPTENPIEKVESGQKKKFEDSE